MKVKSYVYVRPEGSISAVLLSPGDTVPEGVTVTNPDVIEGADSDASADEAKADEPKRRNSRKADGDAS